MKLFNTNLTEENNTKLWSFDLGTSSIGWAILDPEKETIVDGGVRIIPGDLESTGAQERREKRQIRRQYQRRRMRKERMIHFLQKHGLFPKVADEARHQKKLGEELKIFFEQNPYTMRSEALQRAFELHELGRALYHLTQRRGFPFEAYLENKENQAMFDEEKSAKNGITSIPETELRIKEAKTLGEALEQIRKKEGRHTPLRRRYTRRTWYKKEVQTLLEAQKKYHPQLITPAFQKEIEEIIFYQRPLKSQAHLIRHCTFEPQKKVASQANLYYEEYVFYQTLNQIKLDGQPLHDLRRQWISTTCRHPSKPKSNTIAQIAKILKIDDLKRFNYKADQILPSCAIFCKLREILGTEEWNKKSLLEQNNILNKIRTATSRKNIKRYGRQWGIEERDLRSLLSKKKKIEKLDTTIAKEKGAIEDVLSCLTINAQPLTPQEKEKILKKALRAKETAITINKIPEIIRRKEKIDPTSIVALPLAPLYTELRSAFGKGWNGLQIAEQEKIRGIILESNSTAELAQKLHRWIAAGQYEGEIMRKLLALPSVLPKTYANLSEKVIKSSLPYLKKGFRIDQAIPLGSLEKVFKKANNKPFNEVIKEAILKDIKEIYLKSDEKSFTQWLKKRLEEEYALPKEATTYLYHHSQKERSKIQNHLDIELMKDLRNPTVNRILAELRRLINTLLLKHGNPAKIHLETGRELKMSPKKKKQEEQYNKNQQQKRNEAKMQIIQCGKPLTQENIKKILLWREANGQCLYTGYSISYSALFEKYEIDHIRPYKITFDDSFGNLMLAPNHGKYDNRQKKGKQTPYQAFGNDPDWYEITERAKRSLPYYKYRRFVDERPPTLGMLNRHATDSAYIAIAAKELLQHICAKIETVKGGSTSILRHRWGLNTLLIPEFRVEDLAPGIYWAALDQEGRLVAGQIKPDPLVACSDDFDWGFEEEDTKKTKEKQEAYKAWQKEYNDEVAKIKKELTKHGQVVEGECVEQGGQKLFIPQKNRNDHRHHFIDAIVIGYAKKAYRDRINRLSARGDEYEEIKNEPISSELHSVEQIDHMPPPYPDLRNKVKEMLSHIVVSYRQTNRNFQRRKYTHADGSISYHDVVRGSLHDDTYYGKIEKKDNQFKYRQTISAMFDTKNKKKPTTIAKIRNNVLKERVDRWCTLSKEARKYTPLTQDERSSGLPIRRVTLQETKNTLIQLGGANEINRWVAPGNNYIVGIYQDSNQKKWKEEIVSLWDAVQRKKVGHPILPQEDRVGNRILFTMRRWDFFILGIDKVELNSYDWEHLSKEEYQKLHKHIYRLRKFSNNDYNFDLHFYRSELFIKRVIGPKSLKKLNPIKIKIDHLGRITPIPNRYV